MKKTKKSYTLLYNRRTTFFGSLTPEVHFNARQPLNWVDEQLLEGLLLALGVQLRGSDELGEARVLLIAEVNHLLRLLEEVDVLRVDGEEGFGL